MLYPRSFCLDGSAPAYHMDKGGGWCNNIMNCLARRDTCLGSFKQMLTTEIFSGMFRNKPKYNPDFYNWNRIKVRYCDGASFIGDVEEVDPAMHAGCSAGGLTSILHCDNFRSLLPANTTVKCLSDAGKNILAPGVVADRKGTWHDCKLHITKCSSAQLNIMQGSLLSLSIPLAHKMDVLGYRQEFLKALTGFDNSPSRGMFINSCYSHCQIANPRDNPCTFEKPGTNPKFGLTTGTVPSYNAVSLDR
ncbi:putative pectinacetylesterase/NOTUM [Helianthus annuus]|nr:putative pectinacetylesterase/NOTUM [Helianthus annuus]KAJ0868473.1 putative pectinacetylesterase/NOTUM [Helianthus annuus]